MGENSLDYSSFFIEINGLEELEKNEQWFDAINLLKNTMISKKNNSEYWERYLSELLFVLTNWDFYAIGDRKAFLDTKNEFINSYDTFLQNNKQSNNDLLLFGLFKTMFPEIFTNESINEMYIIEDGKNMLKQAYLNNMGNELYRFFYLASNEITKEYIICKKELQKNIEKIFPGKTEIELYFKEIVNSK